MVLPMQFVYKTKALVPARAGTHRDNIWKKPCLRKSWQPPFLLQIIAWPSFQRGCCSLSPSTPAGKRHHKQHAVPRWGAIEVPVLAVSTKELLLVLLGWRDGWLVGAALALGGQGRWATEQAGAIRSIFRALSRIHGVFCLSERGKKMN